MISQVKKFFGIGTDVANKATGQGLAEPEKPAQGENPGEGSILKQQFITQIYAKVIDTIGKFQPKKVSVVDRLLMRTDPDVAFGTAVLRGPIINAEYSVEGEDPLIAAFVQTVIDQHFPQIARAASLAPGLGYQVIEKVWKAAPLSVDVADEDGGNKTTKKFPVAWTFSKFKSIDPRTLVLHVDPATDEWDGVMQYVYFAPGQGSQPPMGLVGTERVALWTFRKEDVFGRLTGLPLYDQAYIPWWDKSATAIYANRYYETYGSPVPIGRADAEGRLNVDGSVIDGFTFMGQGLASYKNGNALVLPSDRDEVSKQFLYDIEFKELTKGGESFVAYLNYKAQQILQGLWTPQRIAQASGGSHLGSKEPQVQAEQMQEFHEEILKEFFAFLNEQTVEPLGRYNFPADQWEASKTKVVPSGISAGQRALYKDILFKCFDEEMSLGASGRVPLMQRIKIDGLFDALNVNQVSAEELEELQAEAEKEAADAKAALSEGGGKPIPDPAISKDDQMALLEAVKRERENA